jgi:hypothetical protein
MGVRTRNLDITAGMRRSAVEREKIEHARGVVERWNDAIAAGRDIWWSPTIRAAIVADMPFAEIYCPGCRTRRNLDLRTLDRHPLASVGSLVLGLRCSWCPGFAPMPKIMGHPCRVFPPASGRILSKGLRPSRAQDGRASLRCGRTKTILHSLPPCSPRGRGS